jgi:hypothetical protein
LPNSVASAKELPVWLVSTFLLLHCEEMAIQRNLSGQPTLSLLQQQQQQQATLDGVPSLAPNQHQRFGSNATTTATNPMVKSSLDVNPTSAGKMDFSTLFNYPSVFSRYVQLC